MLCCFPGPSESNRPTYPTPSCLNDELFRASFLFISFHLCPCRAAAVSGSASSGTRRCSIFLFQVPLHIVISHVLLETPKKFIPHCHPFVLTRTTRSCRRRHEPYQPRHEGGREKFKRFREMLWPFHMSL